MVPVFPFRTAIWRIGLTAVAIHLPLTLVLANDQNGFATNDAKNLARLNCGARITRISTIGTGPATNLVLDDNTLNCELTKGDNAFLITLPNISNLDRLTFINERADLTGTVQVLVSDYRLSPNDSSWTPVGRQMQFGKERFVTVSLAGVEGKYIKILFTTDKAGTIAGIGLYGQQTLAAFAEQQNRAKAVAAKISDLDSRDHLHFNFANLYARARVIWVSSGSKDQANRMIDDDPTTGFDFAPNDAHPTAVVQLSGDEQLRRVSVIYDTQRGRLDIFLLNSLADVGALENLKPVVSIADNAGSGKAAAEFEPRGARYLALRWTPAEHGSGAQTFDIAEIGAFGDTAPTVFDLQAVPEFVNYATALNLPNAPPSLVPTSP